MRTPLGPTPTKPAVGHPADQPVGSQPARRDAMVASPPQRFARAGVPATLAAAVTALLAALVSGFLLLINGSFVLVFLHTISQDGPEWFSRKGTLQFVLFVLPLLMLVAEWMMWDFLRGFFSRRGLENEPWNRT